ncbi:MAG TPA: hypothetical protein VHW23_01585 [Kofleriaceae bacterium]|jgi:hypothetical protein|nr:hypothetical protein [Kofleriaceae bacterium]
MTAIARDAVASDHLVYAWPFPLGPDCDVSCADDELVVMCPAWLVGDRLGPGRHRWRTPDPTRPVSAFFVLTAPVEVSFDMTTMFVIPMSGMPVRLRASGSLQIRCNDPGLLIAQFVGLPFDRVNDGILRSVSRSVERMLARLLTRRVVMAATPFAVTDPGMLGSIVEELIAYNPTAGAVFGVELLRIGHLTIVADDGSSPYIPLPQNDWAEVQTVKAPPNGELRNYAAAAAAQVAQRHGDVSLVDTARGRPITGNDLSGRVRPIEQSSPDITPPPAMIAQEVIRRAKSPQEEALPLPPPPYTPHGPHGDDHAPMHTPAPGAMRMAAGSGQRLRDEARGAILGVGMSQIGHSSVSSAAGEIGPKISPGARVLVPGPNGLMQSATVRQLLQGYYELEVGHSGETIWVPVNNVVPEH